MRFDVIFLLVDSPRLPESDVGVGIMEGWNATIDVDGEVLGILDRREGNRDGFVGNAQLLQDKMHFGRVDPLQTPDFKRFELCRHGGIDGAESPVREWLRVCER